MAVLNESLVMPIVIADVRVSDVDLSWLAFCFELCRQSITHFLRQVFVLDIFYPERCDDPIQRDGGLGVILRLVLVFHLRAQGLIVVTILIVDVGGEGGRVVRNEGVTERARHLQCKVF